MPLASWPPFPGSEGSVTNETSFFAGFQSLREVDPVTFTMNSTTHGCFSAISAGRTGPRQVDVSLITSDNPAGLSTDHKYNDTWHGALGFQHRISQPWLLTGGVAYDSSTLDDANRSPVPASTSAADLWPALLSGNTLTCRLSFLTRI
jgi:hypothetical protein